MKKPAIPATMGVADPVARNLLGAIKENIEQMNGTRGGIVEKLPNNASLSDVVSKVNEIIGKINAHE
jgi:hypothetical protein